MPVFLQANSFLARRKANTKKSATSLPLGSELFTILGLNVVGFYARSTNMHKIYKLRWAKFFVMYNVSPPNFAILLILISFFLDEWELLSIYSLSVPVVYNTCTMHRGFTTLRSRVDNWHCCHSYNLYCEIKKDSITLDEYDRRISLVTQRWDAYMEKVQQYSLANDVKDDKTVADEFC